MGLTLQEQETTITFYRDSDICKVYTSDSTIMTKLDKLVKKSKAPHWKLKEEHRLQSGEMAGKTYETHKDLITFRSDFKKVSDEQREKLSERARKNFGNKRESVVFADYMLCEKCHHQIETHICYKCGECGRKFEGGFLTNGDEFPCIRINGKLARGEVKRNDN